MTTITENQWTNYFGFKRFPFDRPESGNDEFARPEFLASCFVEPKGFERVFGQATAPVTSLLFAARGTGKTACRVMMDYYCQNGLTLVGNSSDEPSYILSVPHIWLDNVLEIARRSSPNRTNPDVFVEHHVEEIMKQAIPVFVDMVAKNTIFANRIKNLSKGNFSDLNSLLVLYSSYLSSSQQEFLTDLGVNRTPISEISQVTNPSQHLQQWAKMMPKIGISATYVLVDGVDELMETAGDMDYAHFILRPLLTHLRIMAGTPHLALKFFLPSDLEPLIVSDPAFRLDRGFVIQKIEWQEADMIKILRERLNTLRQSDYEFRDRTAAGFDMLCVPDLRGEIERNLVRNANGNPRYLMNLCSQMVTLHCAREIDGQDDPFQLNRDDYIRAVEFVELRNQKSSSLNNLKKQKFVRLEQEPAIFKNGQIIDEKYEVRKILPLGAAGQVYCVYDDVFDRMCALKIFNNSALSIESFKNEARSLLKIDHPNIVKVYGWGILKQSRRFYLMSEFVEGNELTEYAKPQNLLPIPKVVSIIQELLSALEYLHPKLDRIDALRNKMREGDITNEEYEEFSTLNEEGLFHRDIKPSNLILSSHGLILIDFNIAAKAVSVGQTFVGTEGYMLPETGIMRWSADGDLFATGVVLYELITGHHPYPERRPTIDTPPANPLEYIPNLNPEFVQIILRAVSCDPQARYHSAQHFHQDLLGLKDKFTH